MSRSAFPSAAISWIPLCALFALVGTDLFAGEGDAFFEKTIRPLLVEHCLECHSEETEHSGNLSLDSAEGWRVGGDLGPAISVGNPNESLLMKAIRYEDRDLEMPPDGKLPQKAIEAFEAWIQSGAADPRKAVNVDSPKQVGLSVADAQQHWAYRPLRTEFDKDSIDGFIEARLNANGLLPESAAPKHVLVRRLYFDLTGLPPSAEEIVSFVNDDSPTAYERLVDRLLGSSAYGEHLARRWMDVARYAESITLRGFVLADAWRYRDYVIEAYNQDRPFDQMIRDQIAGDLIEHSDLEQQKLSCVATGFLALANTNLEDQDKKKLEFDHIDEQLTTIGRAFLGQTIGCARCHDHKFDPIPTKDYYALAAIFRSTVAFKHSNLSMWIRRPLPLEPEVAAEYAGFQRELDELKPRLSQVSKELKELERAKKAEKENETENTQDAETEALVAKKKNLEKQQRKLEALIAKRPMYISISEGKPVESLEVRIRGNTHQTGQPVRRGFLSAFGASAEFAGRIPDDQSGRLELANWIADDRHPLTARVYANRVWSWMMGEGIVATENNFGTTGVEPTDPALLDWLAGELIRSGWSTKHLVRTVVCSDAYRRTSDSDRHRAVDAENELLWRANRKRLPIESIRDAMASLGGDLDHAMLGSEIRANTKSDYEYDHRSKRKSVYWPVFRNSPPPLYTVFDFANSSVSVGERSESTIPTQALAIANHPWVMRQAKQAAKRFGAKEFERVDQLIGNLFESCLGRQPTAAERSTARDFLGPYDSAEPRMKRSWQR